MKTGKKSKTKKAESFADPSMVMENIFKECDAVLNTMKETDSAEEKLTYSETLKNLTESLRVFIEFIDMVSGFDDDDSIPF